MKSLHKTLSKRKPSVILSTCIITSLLYVQSIQAEPLPQRGPIPFYLYDIDSNGYISQAEFHSIRNQRMANRAARGYPMKGTASAPEFSLFDSDKDGQLNPDELARGQKLQLQKRREMMRQSQGTGMDMRPGQGRGKGGGCNLPGFEDFDRNKDGLITPDEFAWGQQQMLNRWDRMRQSQGTGMGMRQDQGRGMGRDRNMPRFEDFDGNQDGYISEQELIEARSMRISGRIQQGYQMRNTANIPLFQEIDKNSDGRISPEEFSAQQKQHQTGRQRSQ